MIVLRTDVLAAALDPKGLDSALDEEEAETVRVMVDALFMGMESLPFDIARRMLLATLLMQRGLSMALEVAELCGDDSEIAS